VQHSSVLVRIAGAFLVAVGSLGLLSALLPLLLREISDALTLAAVSLVCLVAGVGVFRGRAWARFLAIGLYTVGALSLTSVLPLMLIPLAFAGTGILVFAWGPRSGGGDTPAPKQPS
jgi:hypothetical protein